MAPDFSEKFEEEYSRIKMMVKEAKQCELSKDYKNAKLKFLDAAELTLKLSKSLPELEALTFKNIARMLVDSAKEMQILRDMDYDPLPRVPGMDAFKNKPRKEIQVEMSKVGDPNLLQLLIIRTSGIPIYSWSSEKLPEQTKIKINDILFSGAITAVNSLISEVLDKPIQSINFEDGNILLKFFDDLIFVLFSDGDDTKLEDNIISFSLIFMRDLLPRWQDELNKGLSLRDKPEMQALMQEHFHL